MTSQKLLADWADSILAFWFEELTPDDWFRIDDRLDEQIRQRFAQVHAGLKAHMPAHDRLDAKSLLAAVIAFDQFPRNIFRKTPQAYATDSVALELARYAVASGKDRELSTQQRKFLYLPFMHSEEQSMQAESVRLFEELGDAESLEYAHHHSDTVRRFGRFPHRNEILGRRSTSAEIEFLKSEPELV